MAPAIDDSAQWAELLRRDVAAFNGERKTITRQRLSLRGADLSGLDLSDAELSPADLTDVDLKRKSPVAGVLPSRADTARRRHRPRYRVGAGDSASLE